MDGCGDFIAMSVFNIARDKGLLISDTIAIPEPYVQINEVTIDGEV